MMNLFDNQNIELREDEYLDYDTGLIHCKVCRSPRQMEFNLGSQALRVRCLCRCQDAQQEAAKAAAKSREEADRMARYRNAGMTDPSLREYTFANDLGYNPEIDIAKQYVAHWDEMRKCSMGLLFCWVSRHISI